MRECLRRDVAARQLRELARDRGAHRFEHAAIVGDQQHLRIRAVLGLREQVGGDEFGVRRGIGDHEHLGRPRRHVDRGAVRHARPTWRFASVT